MIKYYSLQEKDTVDYVLKNINDAVIAIRLVETYEIASLEKGKWIEYRKQEIVDYENFLLKHPDRNMKTRSHHMQVLYAKLRNAEDMIIIEVVI